jgi:hypothetical protein
MYLEPFYHHSPDIGKRETRSLTIPDGAQGGVPAGMYAFVELYCTARGCDCQRVTLQVVSERDGIVASISYGFDRQAPMAGPFLDPLHRRASYATALLKLSEEFLFTDPMYVARLKRHYRLMKDKLDGPAPREHWWKRKPKKTKRGRRP